MSNIRLFEDNKIRATWDAEKDEWFFSVVDDVVHLVEAQFLETIGVT